MKKIMMGVSLGLAGMSQAHAWNGDMTDMRTVQNNTSGQVVRVKSSTTDCCTLRPVHSHGHQHQHKMVHNGRVYYCTRVAGHGGGQFRQPPVQTRQHYQHQTQQALHAQRARRQALYAAKAQRKAQLLAQQRQRAQMLEAQKRKTILLAQQKQRAAHQALLQAQQRKRAALLLQQKRRQQLLVQQRRQAAQQRALAQYQRPQPQVKAVIVQQSPKYQSGYQRYHAQPAEPVQQTWQRSHSVRIQPIQPVVEPERSGFAHQSVQRHDARVAEQYNASGWQRAATVQSHSVRTPPPPQRTITVARYEQEADCGC